MDLSIIPSYANVLSELRIAWNTVQTSKSLRVVLIESESGMRKTRAVFEFLDSSAAECIHSRVSQVPEPYLPLRSAYESIPKLGIVQEQLQKSSQDISSAWQTALTAVAAAIPMLQPTSSEWERMRQWQTTSLVDSLSDSLEEDVADAPTPVNLSDLFTLAVGELAAMSPVVFFVDDLELADSATLESLNREILPALKDSPVLFVATFDAERSETDLALVELIESVNQFSETLHLKSAPLQLDDIQRLVVKEFPELSLEDLESLAHHIYTATEGILARVQDLFNWVAAQSKEKDFPNIIESIPDYGALIRNQFEQLDKSARLALQMAACQDRYFCLEAVAKAMDRTDLQLKDVFAELASDPKGWIRFNTTVNLGGRPVSWYRFRGQIRYELVYQSVPERDRSRNHRKIAYAMESVYGEHAPTIAGLLVWQFERGGIKNKIAQYQAMIARQANDRGDLFQGLQHAQNGLNLAPEADLSQTLKCCLLIEKGRALRGPEQSYVAVDVLREAHELAEDLKDPELHLQAGLYLGEALLNHNRWDEGTESTRQALKLAAEQKDWSIIAQGMEQVRNRYHLSGQAEEYFALCDDIVKAIGKDQSPLAQVTVAEILQDKGWLYHARHENAAAMEAFGQAFEHLGKLGHPELYPEIHYKLYRQTAASLNMTNDYTQALQEIEKALGWAKASRQRRNRVLARITKAIILWHLGRIDEGEQEYKDALRLLKRSSDLSTLGELEGSYGFFLSNTGRKSKARDMYQRSYNHYFEAHNLYRLQIATNNLAAMNKYLGAFQPALAAYQQLLSEGLAQGNKSRQRISLNHMGDIYRVQNQIGKAEQAHSQAIRLCDEMHSSKAISLYYLGRVHLVNWTLGQAANALLQAKAASRAGSRDITILLVRLALCQGKSSEALTRLREAIDELDKIQDLNDVGIGCLNQGLVHLALGEPQQALSAAQRAFELLRNLESWRVSEAHHLLARCYLARGELERAQAEIDQAKARFMDLGLFHRLYQAENTELHIEDAHESGDSKQWQELSPDELRDDFNHLGI